MKRVSIALVTIALVVAVSACGGGDDSGKSATTTTRAEKTVAPLTGKTVSAAVARRGALSVKIDNHPDARPQVGLDAADIVFEELTEGGITRFLAVFQSQLPPEVGPIRSVRAVDPALITPLGGVFAYSGGTAVNVDAVRQAPVTTVDETTAGAAMHRSASRRPPHNLYGTPTALVALAGDHKAPPKPLFVYGRVAASARPCAHVSIRFSGDFVSIYDWATGVGWKRSSPTGAFTVASGTQVTATNLVVVWVKDQTRESTVGTGDALVLRDGKLVQGKWERRDENDAFHLSDGTGATTALAPGNTWVHLAVQGNTTVDTNGCAPAK
jgi:hypothetical protein